MSSNIKTVPDECAILRQWLATLPGHVDYEHDDSSVSRQEFLDSIVQLTDPRAAVVVFLQDHDESQSLLILAYAAGVERNAITLPRKIKLSSPTMKKSDLDIRDLKRFASDQGFGEPLIYVLSEYRNPIPRRKVALDQKDIGIAAVFLPSTVVATSIVKTQLQILWRLFSAETARSRHQRLSLAIQTMLQAINDLRSVDELCRILKQYCRSQSIYLYERRGLKYIVAGEAHEVSPQPLEANKEISVRDLSDLVAHGEILRSHVYEDQLPTPLRAVVTDAAWMLLPCFTEAVNILSGTTTRYPQYLLLMVGKENVEYLGEDYSLTDLMIGRSLLFLLSNHVPYMGLSEKLAEVLKEVDTQPLGEFSISWFAELARRFIPGIFALGVFPDFPSADNSDFAPQAFSIQSETIRSADSPRANEACLGAADDGPRRTLNCMIFSIATEYRAEQKLVFAFIDQYIQNAGMQLLNVLVEYARSVFSVMNFREYHNATQAQIRHVIRGSLAAAISELELLESRVRIFSRVPTKLVRLLETPTMRDSMADSLLWLTEAYSLADAPRYLLDSFGSSSIRWSDVNPVELVEAVLAISRGEIRRRGLRVEFAPDETSRSRIISADPEFIKIVIFNLIDNAVKYSFQDKYIRVAVNYTNERWRFEVEDVGVPISPEDRKKIFYPWVRSFSQYLASRRPGTGLGLAVSSRILKAHDPGVIFDFTSDPIGEKATARTTFFFELQIKGKGEVAS